MKIVFCTPTYTEPHAAYLAAVEASAPVLSGAGIEHSAVFEVGCPYISHARATMLRKVMDTDADAAVFIDHDMAWGPRDLVKLVTTEGDVVAGTYRFKKQDIEYMGTIQTRADLRPVVRADGAIAADRVPAGFLMVTRRAVREVMRRHPELIYGDPERPSVDLFHHGAHDGVWWGEDYAFSRRWRDGGGTIWLVPDLDLDHHAKNAVYPGNFHKFLLAQPGGANELMVAA